MRMLSRKSWWVAAVAAVGAVVPPISHGDDAKTESRAKEKKTAAASDDTVVIRDVALTKEGAFAGRVVDEQGQAMDGVVVKLRRRGDEKPTETTTDDEGRFRFANLKGGVYLVQTPQSEKWYRMWSADAAPAQASKTVVMTGGAAVMRGQLGFMDPGTTVALLLGGAGVTLAAINMSQINNLQDDVDKIPTSP